MNNDELVVEKREITNFTKTEHILAEMKQLIDSL